MSIKVGLVGLPNVGKSSFFNSLTGSSVRAENYPFCTIDPNISIFNINDTKILKLSEVDNPKSIVYPTIEVYDIAGLIKGAEDKLKTRFSIIMAINIKGIIHYKI